MIKTDQGRMLASLLNRPYKKIVLDRFMKQEEENKMLVTDPEAVKCGIAAHFKEQFRKRKTCLEEMTEEWMKIYAPREWIDAAWYEEVEGKIKEEEWEETLRELKIGTAPGISGISYILIKRARKEAQKVFRTFADICLNLGEVPEKWKLAQIYPIPKDIEWEYSLNNIRPIALIETFRKVVTKVLTKRLTKVLM